MNEIIETPDYASAGETAATVSAEPKEEDRVIRYLKGLNKPPQNRAALAHLRRGLGKPPKMEMEMFPYLGQFLSHEPKPFYENAVFMVAALFAYYPDAPGNVGNLAASLRELSDREKKTRPAAERVSKTLERRLVVLLNAEAENLPRYLRQIIGLLKSKEIPVNWNQLLRDIQNWSSDKRFVQRKWADKFWGNLPNEKNQDEQNISGGTNQ